MLTINPSRVVMNTATETTPRASHLRRSGGAVASAAVVVVD
jgi:hypothetical protein